MRCGRCGKPLIEISMRIASAAVTLRRCAHCDSQTWATPEGEIALEELLELARSAERTLPQRGNARNLI